MLQAALPAGSLLCALVLAHRPPLQKAGPTLLWAVAGFGLATIGFGFSRWFWLSSLMLFLCGAMDNISVVVRHTLVQLLTPDEKRGSAATRSTARPGFDFLMLKKLEPMIQLNSQEITEATELHPVTTCEQGRREDGKT